MTGLGGISRPGPRWRAGWLAGLGVALMATAGLLLWRREGESVFSALVTAALAWCF